MSGDDRETEVCGPRGAAEAAQDSALDGDFERLSREREPGEPLTAMDRTSAQRVLDAYWPRFRPPQPLPDRWR